MTDGTESSTCNQCGGNLVGAARPVGPSQVERFLQCVRRRKRSQHETVYGQLEVEPEWFVRVGIPEGINAPQLAAIRASHPAFQGAGLAEIRKVLAAQPVALLGPYLWPHDAAIHRDRLRAVHLVAEVVACQAQ